MCCLSAVAAWSASSCSERRDLTTVVCYRRGADGPLGRRSGFWYGRCRLLLAATVRCVVPVARRPLRSAGGSVARAISRSRRCFQRAGSVSSWPPPVGRGSWGLMPLAARHTAISPNEGGARVTSRWCPDWLGVTLAGVILDLVGEVGDQLGSLCQVASPDGMVMERWWNAGEPGQRTWVGRRERWEAPVEDGGHVACGAEVASGGGCQQVAEWVLPGFGREARAGGLAGSARRVRSVSPGRYWSAWSSSATVWGPTSCSAATWRPSV